MHCICIFWIVFCKFLLFSSVYAEESSWIKHWVEAINLSKDPHKNQEAIAEYKQVLTELGSDMNSHVYLYNELGNVYLKTFNFNEAVQCFNQVLNKNNIDKRDIANALHGRSIANLALGNIREFVLDCNSGDEIEPFIQVLEESNEYIVFKTSCFINDSKDRERLVKVLLNRKTIECESDVIFTPTGLGIIKRSKTNKDNKSGL